MLTIVTLVQLTVERCLRVIRVTSIYCACGGHDELSCVARAGEIG